MELTIKITEEMMQRAMENALASFKTEIGMTIKECVEKQVAKKPSFEGDGYADGQLVYDTWICPCCEKKYEVDYEEYDFCPNCGQKIDWKEDGDNDAEND